MSERRIILRSLFETAVIVAAGIFLGLILWSAYAVFVLHKVDVYVENGLLENTQAILLAIACVVFFTPIIIEKRSDKLILLFCSLICYVFVLRELDVQSLDIPAALKVIGYGAGRNTTVAAALIAIFVYAGFNFSYYKTAAIDFLKSKHGILMIIGCGFLFLGDFFEKYDSMIHHVYFEEVSELCGNVFILLAAFAAGSSLNSVHVRANGPANVGR
jgi:uncharacterized membrane protein YGL010W